VNPRILLFSNQKGGVGKTTLTRELGIYASSLGRKVLLVDCDPQGNLSKSLLEEPQAGLYEALSGEGLKLSPLGSQLFLLTADLRLTALERRLLGEIDAYSRLKVLFQDERFQDFDFLFLDTPPSLGVLTVNALSAAGHLIIPMNPSLYSMQGTNDLLATVAKVKTNLNPELSLTGVIINAWDSVPVITSQIRSEIEGSFGDLVFATVLSKCIKLEEAIAQKCGVIHHKRLERSRVKQELEQLGQELFQRLDGGEEPGGRP